MTRRSILWIAGATVSVVVALVLWGQHLERAADERFHARVAELSAEGFAVSSAVVLGEAPPGAEDAAREIRAALDALGGDPGFPWTKGLTGAWDATAADPWPASVPQERLAALADWIESARPYYDRVSAAVARPAIRFPVALDAAGTVEMWHVTVEQQTQKLLHARAHVARLPADRLAACRDMLRFGRHLVPLSPIETMISAAFESSAIEAVRAGVESGALDAVEARRWLDAELQPGPPGIRDWIARAELAFLATTWDAELRGVAPPAWARPTGLRRLRDRATALLRGIPYDEPTSEEVVACLDDSAALVRGERAWPVAGDEARTPSRMQRTAAFVQIQIGERLTRTDAAVALARVALAVRARRDATGAWPEDLFELRGDFGGTVPTDPYLDWPFEYEIGPDLVRVSSVGRRPGASDVPLDERRERGLVWEFPADPANAARARDGSPAPRTR